LGGTVYLVGGYDGTSWIGSVLATTNGTAFTRVATLPVPVRYAAVAGVGKRIWVFGGLTPAGPSRAIQRVNLATGKAAVVGRMPAPISAATAVTLTGRIFIAGGQVAGDGRARLVASRAVLSYNPAGGRVTVVGRLPVAVTNAAAAVVGGTAFLVGGNNGRRQVTTVARLRLVAG